MGWRVEVWLPCAGAQALATFAVRACEKLRVRGQVTAAAARVFAHSDAFRPELRHTTQVGLWACPHRPQTPRSCWAPCESCSATGSDTRSRAWRCSTWRHRMSCRDLFGPTVVGNQRLMATMDRINQKFGRDTAGPGASGWHARPAWACGSTCFRRTTQRLYTPSPPRDADEFARALTSEGAGTGLLRMPQRHQLPVCA